MNKRQMFREAVMAPTLQNEQNNIEWLLEDQACEFLGIKKKTLQNYISSGRIPSSYYIKTIDGKKTVQQE